MHQYYLYNPTGPIPVTLTKKIRSLWYDIKYKPGYPGRKFITWQWHARMKIWRRVYVPIWRYFHGCDRR